MSSLHTCGYCGTDVRTPRGLLLHIRRISACDSHFQRDRCRHLEEANANFVMPPTQHSDSAVSDLDEHYSNVADDVLNSVDDIEALQFAAGTSESPYEEEQPQALLPLARVATVEDVLDEGEPWQRTDCQRFLQPYPGAGKPREDMKHPTVFEQLRDDHGLSGNRVWGPFRDQDDWELGRFLVKHMGHGTTNECLKLSKVCLLAVLHSFDAYVKLSKIQQSATLSFKNNYELLKKNDQLLQSEEFLHEIIQVPGDALDDSGAPMVDELELYYRNPVEVIRELVGNPLSREHMIYAPEKVFRDEAKTTRVYDETWSGDWWWDTQVRAELPNT